MLPNHHEQIIAGLCDGVTNGSADRRVVANEKYFFPGSVHDRLADMFHVEARVVGANALAQSRLRNVARGITI